MKQFSVSDSANCAALCPKKLAMQVFFSSLFPPTETHPAGAIKPKLGVRRRRGSEEEIWRRWWNGKRVESKRPFLDFLFGRSCD